MKVKEEGHPGGGLVFRHRCYDGDVDLSIAVNKEREQNKQRWEALIRTGGK